MKAPSLADEALVSLRAFNVMKELFSKEELARFVSFADEEIENVEEVVASRAAFSLLPSHVTSFLESVAYLDMTITGIEKDGKPIVVVDQNGNEKEINTFVEFLKFATPALTGIHVFNLVNKLVEKVEDWLDTQKISPSEVKNS